MRIGILNYRAGNIIHAWTKKYFMNVLIYIAIYTRMMELLLIFHQMKDIIISDIIYVQMNHVR